jgi:hypothetical protein
VPIKDLVKSTRVTGAEVAEDIQPEGSVSSSEETVKAGMVGALDLDGVLLAAVPDCTPRLMSR